MTEPQCDGCGRELDLMRDLAEAQREYEGPMAEEIALWKSEAGYWKKSALLQAEVTRTEFMRAERAVRIGGVLADAIENIHSPSGAECRASCDLCIALAKWRAT